MTRIMSILGIGVFIAVLGGLFIWQNLKTQPANLTPNLPTLEDGQYALRQGDAPMALEISRQLLANAEPTTEVLMLAAEATSKLQRFDEALAFYQRVSAERPMELATAKWAMGEIYCHLGWAREAFASLEQSLDLNPELGYAHERLIWLLNTFGRRRETQPHLLALLRSGQTTIEHLMYLGNLNKEVDSQQELSRFEHARPLDLLPNLPRAKKAIQTGDFGLALKLLSQLQAQYEQLLEVHVVLAQAQLKLDSFDRQAWEASLPAGADDSADVWLIRGLDLKSRKRLPEATRCFLEAVRRDSNHLQAHNEAAQALSILDANDLAKPFAQRAKMLQELNLALEQIWVSPGFEPPLQQAAELCMELGRMWEAVSWGAFAQSAFPQSQWIEELRAKLASSIKFDADLPQTLVSSNLVANASWVGDFPLPVSYEIDSPEVIPDTRIETSIAKKQIVLEDATQACGLEFDFYNSYDVDNPGRRIFEIIGGGIGCLDFDLDGIVDVFMSQGRQWPLTLKDPIHEDQLFRVILGEGPDDHPRVFNVTNHVRISESAFGQGVAIGDLNADGWDDIYVCNVGRNQVWLNQGDGTFIDGSPIMLADSFDPWTVSAAIADLNGDGLPEIYNVNYVSGDDVFTRRCDIAGQPRACSPLVFQPAKQTILVSNRDGVYRRYEHPSVQQLSAYGLGAIAAKFGDDRLPSIFVAVDQQANLLLQSNLDDSDFGFSISDTGLLSGCAYNAAGEAQACMGIAAGDVNRDGQVDLFVTNFYREHDTLYVQDQGTFSDATAAAGLLTPTLPMLGFGTQFIDLDLDGWLDIVALNGHIDDQSHINIPEHMPAQCFINIEGQRFIEVPGTELGGIFHVPGLGRALVVIDLDQDGSPDLISNDLEGPSRILLNRTPPESEFLRLTLVGVQSERSAIGCQASLSGPGGYEQKLQLIGGSGYLASNERSLNFAVPRGVTELSLDLVWPSGVHETYDALNPGSSYVAIESNSLTRFVIQGK
ncbi:MAG: VCBS repeat-containing protein [Planctomycetales bacterium]|nr:VCBS repeat-containing protein [Planctomycetales bacterium]